MALEYKINNFLLNLHMDSRYVAQMRVEGFGRGGQEKLADSRVLVVGCGALGSPVAMYLAGAGVGHITLVDFDTVDLSNLHRQVFYRESEAGKYKAECLAMRIKELNPDVNITTMNSILTDGILKSGKLITDVVVDCADNPSTTYMLDFFCKENRLPLSSAGVGGWEAQVFTSVPGSLSYSEVFPRPEVETGVLPCSLTGIIGPVSAYAASIQASEVIKLILGLTDKSRLYVADLKKGMFNVIC